MKENNLEQVILFAFVSNPVVWRRWKLLPFQTELPLDKQLSQLSLFQVNTKVVLNAVFKLHKK